MTLTLTPSGHLVMIDSSALTASDSSEIAPFGAEAIARAFTESQAAGIMALTGGKSAAEWPPSWLFWRDFGTRYLLLICHRQPTTERLDPAPP